MTAGNASGLNDGAAAVIVMSAKKAEALGLTPLARIKAYASAGVDPKVMGMGPVPASKALPGARRLDAADLDLLEINEAFAAQALRGPQADGLGYVARSTSTAARSRSATRSARPAAASWSRCCTKCRSATRRRASRRCASAAAWAWRWRSSVRKRGQRRFSSVIGHNRFAETSGKRRAAPPAFRITKME